MRGKGGEGDVDVRLKGGSRSVGTAGESRLQLYE